MTAKREARPLRTVVFCPGNDPDRMHAAVASGADAVMIDIEEPRTPFTERQREEVRGQVQEFIGGMADGPGTPLVMVRVQSIESGQTFRDLRGVWHDRLAGILLPKVLGPADVHGADALLTALEVDSGRRRGSVFIYPILETAESLRLAYDIGMASDRVAYMGGAVSRFGDIVQAIGFRWTVEGRESLFLRSKVLIDARAAGIRWPISGMWGGNLDDEDGLRRWANELRDIGYFGMLLGDPKLVPIVREVFSPSAAELSYWQDLDRLATEAEAIDDAAPITYGDPNAGEGHVVHMAHVGSARMNLAWARALGMVPEGGA